MDGDAARGVVLSGEDLRMCCAGRRPGSKGNAAVCEGQFVMRGIIPVAARVGAKAAQTAGACGVGMWCWPVWSVD